MVLIVVNKNSHFDVLNVLHVYRESSVIMRPEEYNNRRRNIDKK